ncbi:MAG: Ada metal-binding domain-containing protein [Reichenbachiella sp.]|uniref:Ada metal-binding domain-containing protein n=1 Tax=Reichenbachiella sp. TaxID=2184521 RepID=UPI003296A569
MIKHTDIDDNVLHQKIKESEILYGGNLRLKIYGTLQCKSGKRMKAKNRVFFKTIEQAKELGFRPCGHCLPIDYKTWKNGPI